MEKWIVVVFILGYLAIALEHLIKINKSAVALITGVLCWVVLLLSGHQGSHAAVEALLGHLGELSGILFFLLGAMTIVELIDSHSGFTLVACLFKTTSKHRLLWGVGLLCFFMSAVLDNLTTTIVMVTLLKKVISKSDERLLFAGIVVIAANAGGAWSPIGDVTTTMLWIGGRVTAARLVQDLFLPSLACLAVPLAIVSFSLHGTLTVLPAEEIQDEKISATPFERNLVLFLGMGLLLMVPVFKTLTGLPPFAGMLLALGILWAVTDILHIRDRDRGRMFSASEALHRIDSSSILFFLGILLAVGALQVSGKLSQLALFTEHIFHRPEWIAGILGVLSAVIDNVPLVGGAIAMYDLSFYPVDHPFWQMLAYSAGTGGSMLIIGSAAGVAAMGLAKINFFWYLKKIAPLAAAGFLAGGGGVFVTGIGLNGSSSGPGALKQRICYGSQQ